MTKRVVVGLDPSEYSQAAQRIAFARAKSGGGTVVGVAVIDEPGIEKAEAGAGVGASAAVSQAKEYHLQKATETCKKLIANFEAGAKEAGVSYESVRQKGSPVEVLVKASFSADLVIIGTRTHFQYETTDDPGDTLRNLLLEKVCPVLAVPKEPHVPERVIFPHSGSVTGARAMRMFNYLTQDMSNLNDVILLNVNSDEEAGKATLEAPATYLSAHGRNVTTMVESGDRHKIIMDVVRKNQPAVVVLGATMRGSVSTFLFGSVTKTLIEAGDVPIFISA